MLTGRMATTARWLRRASGLEVEEAEAHDVVTPLRRHRLTVTIREDLPDGNWTEVTYHRIEVDPLHGGMFDVDREDAAPGEDIRSTFSPTFHPRDEHTVRVLLVGTLAPKSDQETDLYTLRISEGLVGRVDATDAPGRP